MLIRAIYGFIFTLTLSLLLAVPCDVFAQAVTTAAETEQEKPRKNFDDHRQLSLGIEVFDPVMGSLAGTWHKMEGEVIYYYKKDYYLVAEGGWGGSSVDYDNLKYNTNDFFGRLGFNRNILIRERAEDWDLMFLGMRAAMGHVNRGISQYTVTDSLWGNASGQGEARSFGVVWAEITCGMRVELFRGVMAGWNVRGKFLLNGKSFRDLAPANISGYGRGDKNANFGFNLYLDYAIRWHRQAIDISEEHAE